MGITNIEVLKDLPTGDFREKENFIFTEETDGVWIIYGWDTMPYPLFISNDELKARQYMEVLGYSSHIKFWRFNTEFGYE
jgi:hypothetical protein